MRRGVWAAWVVGVVLFAGVFGAARDAAADEAPAWSAFKGQVIFSDVLIAPSSQFPSGQVMAAALRRFERPAVDGRDGFWRFHFVAFLDPAPAATTLKIVATDITDAKKRLEVKVFEVPAPADARELHMNDWVLSDAMGFQHGHRYEIAIASGGAGGADETTPAGKQDVYARGVVTLR